MIRKGDKVFAYLNVVLIRNTALNIASNRQTGDIRCPNHGARFAVGSRKCLFGPCIGEFLILAPVELRVGKI